MRDEHLLINGAATAYAPASDAIDADLLQTTREQDHRYFTEKLEARAHTIMTLPRRPALRSFGPTQVPAGQYLMLGDSRDNSKDSRYIGFVPRDSIVGRAFNVAYSLDSDHWYRPRIDRFMAPLQ
jgi:signal peptidase I